MRRRKKGSVWAGVGLGFLSYLIVMALAFVTTYTIPSNFTNSFVMFSYLNLLPVLIVYLSFFFIFFRNLYFLL